MENFSRNYFFNLHQHEIGVIAASFSPQGRSTFFIVSQRSSSFYQESTHVTQSCKHSILLYLIPVLQEFLDLKYQGNPNTPFQTHPFSMYAAIFAFFAYCLVSYNMLGISLPRNFQLPPTYTSVYKSLIWISGYLSVASLVSILSPQKVDFLPYVVYFMLAIAKLLHLIMSNETIMEDMQFREWRFQESSVARLWRRLMNLFDDHQTSSLPMSFVQRNTIYSSS